MMKTGDSHVEVLVYMHPYPKSVYRFHCTSMASMGINRYGRELGRGGTKDKTNSMLNVEKRLEHNGSFNNVSELI